MAVLSVCLVMFSLFMYTCFCFSADPLIEQAVQASSSEDAVVVRLFVGNREQWKDPSCPFRTDKRTALRSIPTLVKLGGRQRLSGDQILNVDLIAMLFNDC